MSEKGRKVGNPQYEPCTKCGLPLGKRSYTPRHACSHAVEIAALRERVEALTTPLCIGRRTISRLAAEGQWVADDGRALIAADDLFKADPWERAEKAEQERDEARAKLADIDCHHGEAGVSCGMNLTEDYACASCFSLVKQQRDLLDGPLLEASEDVAALVTVLRGEKPWDVKAAWERIRERKLLEKPE